MSNHNKIFKFSAHLGPFCQKTFCLNFLETTRLNQFKNDAFRFVSGLKE